MKFKIFTILTMFILIFSLTACSGPDDDFLGAKPSATVAPLDINEGINIEDPETFGHDNGEEVLGFFISMKDGILTIKAEGVIHELSLPEGYVPEGEFARIPEGKVIAASYTATNGKKLVTAIEIVEQMM